MEERKKEERNVNQDFACIGKKPVKCLTCANANGEPPWADGPMKSYCIAYPREDGMRKPAGVYYDGKECEFYRKRK